MVSRREVWYISVASSEVEILLTYPTNNPVTQSQKISSNSTMNHLTIVHSTPLDSARTFTTKSKSATSSFSLKDQLKSLRRKSTPSSSTTHHVKLNGLKSDKPVRGTSHLPLPHQAESTEPDSTSSDPTQTRPQQNGDIIYGTAFGNVRSGWLQQPTSVSFRH